MQKHSVFAAVTCAALCSAIGCGDSAGSSDGASVSNQDDPAAPSESPEAPTLDVHSYVDGCLAVRNSEGQWLAQNDEEDGYGFVEGDLADATPFTMKAADLATYLFYDPQRGYVVGDDGKLVRQTSLRSDVTEMVDRYVSEALWKLEAEGEPDENLYQLRHEKTGGYLSTEGVSDVGAIVSLVPASGCTEYPELTVDAIANPHVRDLSTDANGDVQARTWPDGSVWGIVEAHTHLTANRSFGGGGVVHGATFHPLGVEHALGDCTATHGPSGIRDLFGAVFEDKVSQDHVFQEMVPDLLQGKVTGLVHETKGYPDFTDWPNAPYSSTHQTQYYKWLERAWMGGLRLMVQHTMSNSVICELSEGLQLQTPRYGCADMASVDRSIEETFDLERYIDAQSGGPGRGFFRIVTSPEQARQVINDGKLAVVLGIETSNLFDCMLTPRAGQPACNEEYVLKSLDAYYARGIRSMFPVHKFDNAFSAGDGNRGFIEVGNFLNTGLKGNFVKYGCPDVPVVFDKGNVQQAGLNEPRNSYLAPSPIPLIGTFPNRAISLLPLAAPGLLGGQLEGEYCQRTGLTQLGEFLIQEIMKRGMILEVDHFPKHAYKRVFDMLNRYDYPPAGTHGSKGPDHQVYALGGYSTGGTRTCRDPNKKGTMMAGLQADIAAKKAVGAYPGEAWSWDLNGFASYRKPRFGPKSECSATQEDPIAYPFTSYGGDVTFTQPRIGNRVLDFNTEGLVHIGLMPEFIEDLRRDAESDADLEPVFRSAEAYLRMWEKAERRSGEIKDDCGDGQCSGNDTCELCPQDCGECAPSCGDGWCNSSETCTACPEDCGLCLPPVPDPGGGCTAFQFKYPDLPMHGALALWVLPVGLVFRRRRR